MRFKTISLMKIIAYIYEEVSPIFLYHTIVKISIRRGDHVYVCFEDYRNDGFSFSVRKTAKGFRIWPSPYSRPFHNLKELEKYYEKHKDESVKLFGEFK